MSCDGFGGGSAGCHVMDSGEGGWSAGCHAMALGRVKRVSCDG